APHQRARTSLDRPREGLPGVGMNPSYARRRRTERVMFAITALATVATLAPLFLVRGVRIWRGGATVSWAFLPHLPVPVGETGGGLANAIVGSGKLLLVAALVGLPVGLLGGVYLAEFGDRTVAGAIRYAADVINGLPSIVVGIVVYALLVVPMHHFSTLAGGVALGLITIPIGLRTTEEFIRLVPPSLYDAALALGAPQWVAIVRVVIPAAARGITAGKLLALAPRAGETAPPPLTAFHNRTP